MIAWLQSVCQFAQNMAIKAIFFDAAGTLIKPARRVGESYAVIARKYGIEASAAEIAERFHLCFHTAPPLAFPGAPAARITDLERAWWKELVRRIFAPWEGFQRFDDYFAELFAYFAQPEAWLLYPEVAETLSALDRRGVVLDVISNFDSRLVGILEGLGIAHCFEHIFVSSRVGYAKPDCEIFRTALERHSLKAGDALHVGDSEEKDLHGANNAGLTGVLIERNGERNSDLSPCITSLRSIFSFLDELDQR
jgi:putative hydrolase of the HAD superfamily